MTLENVSLASYITGLLRNNITDPNLLNRHSQFGNWIFADKPKIMKLLNEKNNFPRISVESIGSTTDSEMGMSCTEHVENANLKITVWTVQDLICTIQNTISEPHTYTVPKYELENLPVSTISLVTSGGQTYTLNTDYCLIDDNSDGFNDTIEWLGVNTPVNGEIFNVSYQRKASTDELCRFIAYEINKYLRDNWRLWNERIVWSYRKTGGIPIDFDNEIGVYKYELTCSFQGLNIGDNI